MPHCERPHSPDSAAIDAANTYWLLGAPPLRWGSGSEKDQCEERRGYGPDVAPQVQDRFRGQDAA